jgi:glycosyltransferase involved in cell wall biosynthesis
MAPFVSVLIDTYNHERYIEQAIVSVTEQDFPASDFEILVVDDGSTDRTPEIVRKFAPRVRLLRKKNGGQASALNAGIAEARGDVVAFLDGDDWFASGKLTAVMNALSRNPELAGVGHGYYEVDDASRETKVRVLPHPQLLSLATPSAARECLLALPCLHMAAFTVRKTLLEKCLPISERLIFDADSPIAMAAMAAGALALELPLLYYRRHADNLDVVDGTVPANLCRKYQMAEAMYETLYPMLLRMGVPPVSVSELLDGHWAWVSREVLRTSGGSRMKALRTEMRQFRYEHKDPGLAYSLFKYGVVGAAALLFPPRRFYQLRDWYARKNLRRFREQFAKSR